jgi:hypothetical protein
MLAYQMLDHHPSLGNVDYGNGLSTLLEEVFSMICEPHSHKVADCARIRWRLLFEVEG